MICALDTCNYIANSKLHRYLNPLMPNGSFNICCLLQHLPLRVDSALRALSTLRGLRGAPEVLPLSRETQSLGKHMMELGCENATVGKNGLPGEGGGWYSTPHDGRWEEGGEPLITRRRMVFMTAICYRGIQVLPRLGTQLNATDVCPVWLYTRIVAVSVFSTILEKCCMYIFVCSY